MSKVFVAYCSASRVTAKLAENFSYIDKQFHGFKNKRRYGNGR